MLQLKHERFLVPPSPWNIHAATNNGTVLVSTPPGCKRKHGDVTSSSHVCSCLLEAPLATTPGQPVPHYRRWWVLGWQIRCMAVSRDATVRHPGLGSLPSSQVRLVCPWQLLHLHGQRLRLCFTGGWRLRWGPFDVHIKSHPPSFSWLHAKWLGDAQIQCCSRACRGSCRATQPFRNHCLHVPAPQIRGLLTAMAERAQQQAFNAPDPELDAALIHCVRLAVAAEKAYDAPKKVEAIIQLGRRLLTEAGLTNPEIIWIRACPQGTARCTARPLAPNSTRQRLASFESSHLAGRCRSRHPWPHVSPQVREWPCGSFGTFGTGIHFGNLCY